MITHTSSEAISEPARIRAVLILRFVDEEETVHGQTGLETSRKGTLYPAIIKGDNEAKSLGPIDGALIPDTFEELIDLIINRLRGDNQNYRMDLYLFRV